jgi:hypothetical protein
LSRIRIFALFAILAALATTFAACGGGDDDGGGSGSDDPQKVVEGASLEGVKSGELDLSLHVNAEGEEGGEVDITLSGPFEEGAKGELPQADMALTVDGSSEGEKIKFNGGLTLLTDRAFVEYKGTAYEVDPTAFGFLKSTFEQAQQQGGEEEITACQEAAEGIKFSQFADNLENAGEADVEGTSTTKVSGDLNVSGAIDALIKLTENPACASQLEQAGPLPISELEEAKGELSKAIKKAHLDLYVGEDDIVRKMTAELTIVPPDATDEKVELDMDLTLSGVNEEQTFDAPENAKPLDVLFKQLGVNPLELLEAAGGEGGLEGLLEGITGGTGTGSSSGGGSAGANSEAYVQCLQEAENAAQMQKCSSLIE